MPQKPVYKVLYLATEPSVCTRFVKKVTKKVLTLFGVRGIIYKSTRYGTEVPRSLDEIDEEKLLRFEQTQDLRTR